MASVGIMSCPPAYGWDVGHASSAPSCLPWGVNWAALPAPGCSHSLSVRDGDAACVCAHLALLPQAVAWHSQWSVSATGCCVAFSRKGRKAHSLWQRQQGGRGESPAAAGAKWGCFLPWLLSALCWKVLFSFRGYETQAMSVLGGVQAGACCLCEQPPACLFS